MYFFLSFFFKFFSKFFNGLVIGDRLASWLGLFLKKSRFIASDNSIPYIGCAVKRSERFGHRDT